MVHEEVSFFKGIKKVFKHKSYITLLFVFLVVSTAVQVKINVSTEQCIKKLYPFLYL